MLAIREGHQRDDLYIMTESYAEDVRYPLDTVDAIFRVRRVVLFLTSMNIADQFTERVARWLSPAQVQKRLWRAFSCSARLSAHGLAEQSTDSETKKAQQILVPPELDIPAESRPVEVPTLSQHAFSYASERDWPRVAGKNAVPFP
jgi:hypothetical protein